MSKVINSITLRQAMLLQEATYETIHPDTRCEAEAVVSSWHRFFEQYIAYRQAEGEVDLVEADVLKQNVRLARDIFTRACREYSIRKDRLSS